MRQQRRAASSDVSMPPTAKRERAALFMRKTGFEAAVEMNDAGLKATRNGPGVQSEPICSRVWDGPRSPPARRSFRSAQARFSGRCARPPSCAASAIMSSLPASRRLRSDSPRQRPPRCRSCRAACFTRAWSLRAPGTVWCCRTWCASSSAKFRRPKRGSRAASSHRCCKSARPSARRRSAACSSPSRPRGRMQHATRRLIAIASPSWQCSSPLASLLLH